jgi:hypothetical protein
MQTLVVVVHATEDPRPHVVRPEQGRRGKETETKGGSGRGVCGTTRETSCRGVCCARLLRFFSSHTRLALKYNPLAYGIWHVHMAQAMRHAAGAVRATKSCVGCPARPDPAGHHPANLARGRSLMRQRAALRPFFLLTSLGACHSFVSLTRPPPPDITHWLGQKRLAGRL